MRFAIIGGGFAGLAVTWFLLHYTQGSVTVDLYDPEPIGGGPSGLSSGLLHTYAGKRARLAWKADHCLRDTHRLLTVAARAIGKPLILSNGILRPALSEQQIVDFQASAAEYADTQWWDKKKCESAISGLTLPSNGGGLFIKNGLTIDVQAYIHGLWQACALLGTQYHQQAALRLKDFELYDKILIAMGPMTKNFPGLKDLPISPVKGQIIELAWPDNIAPLPFSLVSQKYIVMRPGNKSCIVGATFEHGETSFKAEPEKAMKEILPHIHTFFPSLKDAPVLGVRAAFRASSYNHLPLLGKVSDKFFFFTGLGSKGLLYHAWLGKRVARAMLSGDISHFPKELYHHVEPSPDMLQG